ncbi:putative uncharacterized protein DDB_G0271606 [Cyclospora cayetanensis]|uniref:C2H2-type domain-containing protein n=1 Tax=Cyclospora cayetanensis TaxID=88456 RepID=A0A6P6RYJ9_9EIME|nr:putative uncharacterized protein DDB_G0271606 [Cyclospora cayetanensis]
MSLKQPVTQVRLTNVAVVRLRLGGERFEVACYKNKVINWREGKETNLNEVLQIDAVFQNVSKGELARKAELLRYFGTDDRRTCILKILEKGELQVSELERRQQLESHFNDIVSLVIDLTYSAVTGLPLSRSAVSGALKDLGFAVRLQQPPKAQALHAALLLQHHNPGQIRRRLMRLKMQLPGAAAAAAASMLHYIVRECAGIIETQDPTVDVLLQRQQQDVSSAAAATEWLVVFLVPPGAYREVEEKVQEAGGSLSVVAWNCLHGTQKEQQLQLKMEQDQLQQQLDELRQQQAQLQQDLEVESQRRLQVREEEQQRRQERRQRRQEQLQAKQQTQKRIQAQQQLEKQLRERQMRQQQELSQQLLEQELEDKELLQQHLKELEQLQLQLQEQRLQEQEEQERREATAAHSGRSHREGTGCPNTPGPPSTDASVSNSRRSSFSSSSSEDQLCCCCCAEWGDDDWTDTTTRAQRKNRGSKGRKQRQPQQRLLPPGASGGFVGVPCPLHASTCVHQRDKTAKPIDSAPRRTQQHQRRRQLQQQQKLQQQQLKLQEQQQKQQQPKEPELHDSLTREALRWLNRDVLQQHQEESTTTAFPEASPSASTAQQQEQRGPRCRVCGDMFKDVVELRVHCKSSRHATNLRRQADKLPPLADAEWNELQLDKHLMAGVPTEVRGF